MWFSSPPPPPPHKRHKWTPSLATVSHKHKLHWISIYQNKISHNIHGGHIQVHNHICVHNHGHRQHQQRAQHQLTSCRSIHGGHKGIHSVRGGHIQGHVHGIHGHIRNLDYDHTHNKHQQQPQAQQQQLPRHQQTSCHSLVRNILDHNHVRNIHDHIHVHIHGEHGHIHSGHSRHWHQYLLPPHRQQRLTDTGQQQPGEKGNYKKIPITDLGGDHQKFSS